MKSKRSRFLDPVSKPRLWGLVALLSALTLAGCTTFSAKRTSYDTEEFDSTTTHTRTFPTTTAQTCEAARRALLSQGYLITAANADLVTGRKNFQPANEVHLEVEVRVVCAKEAQAGKGKPKRESTLAFVTALQDRYSLKKTNNSASVGVGVLGSLSLPISASDDAMVKVASETVTDNRFYDRFFVLLDQYLAGDIEAAAQEPEPVAVPAPAPLAVPSAASLVVSPSSEAAATPATSSATATATATPPAAPPAQAPAATPAAAQPPAPAPSPAPAAPASPSSAASSPGAVTSPASATNIPIPASTNQG
ncbi:DUF2242 domain-containing protein [Variovorax robiniae]|uniref:DUF2242 domain-containing protein n=1 Tax=Variovorax robiniae TaxID=1836199 RepID=A0ABU8X608_9BURK